MNQSTPLPDAPHLDLAVHGMHCAGCVARVEKALSGVPGVEGASVNLALEQARVRLSRATPATTDELLRALVRAGYRAEVQSDEPAPPAAPGAAVPTLESPPPTRELVAGALISSAFMAEMALHFARVDWRLPPWLALALATVVQAWVGARFYAGAWSALRARTATMDTLVVLGTSAAYGLSAYGVLAGHAAHGAHSYFEAASVVVTLVLLGKWLEARARRSTGEALRALMQLRPATARVLAADGSTRDVPIAQVKVGDLVLVRPGERLPVDGEIEAGEAHLDESLLTGESLPVSRGPGARVVTGAVNLDGALTLRTRAVGADTSLAKIIGLVRGAQASKPRIQHQVDRVAAIFVPTVLVLASATLVGWWFLAGDLTRGVDAAIAVLVVACPCALGLATPAALIVGTGLGARHGILIRDADALESAARIDVVLFDKTGTLTEGAPAVVSVHSESGESESSLLALAASLQQHSEHPLARAILARAATVGVPPRPCKRFVAVAGRGVRGEVDERTLLLGNARLLTEQGIVLPDTATDAETAGRRGATLIWLAQVAPEPSVLGWFTATDSVRPNAKQAVAALHAQGFSTALVSGDQRVVAEHVAAELGLGATHAPMLPAEKLAVLQTLRAAGQRVAMVGDGVNDAPALAAADVGIAMGTGTDVAVSAAGITLMRPDPRLVVDALLLARLTQRKIWQNLFWAFLYNVLAIPAAVAGTLSPMLAGAAMAFSSVSVVTNALFLKRSRLTGTTTPTP